MAIALVTGGSRGIGRATALLLAQEGYTVAVNYQQNLHAAQEVMNLITQAGGKAFVLQADISDENQVVAMFTAIDQHDEPLAALVNNAGILFTQCTVENLTAERINRVLSTNVTGYFLCCREAVKRMALKNGGSGGAIVNVSSVASRLGSPGEYVDYAASKGAIDTLTTGLSLEVAAQGIRVNCVRPGFIYTEMHASGGEPGRVDRVKSNIPMQRGGQAEEVAQAIVWLLSDKASYVTGSFIDLAAGNKTGKLSDRMQQVLHPVLHRLKASRRCWQSPLCTS
ncbi:NAD(P)-binding oxidoreductase with NAD(P)-binding Rossmann-fold domain [Escherichia coli]|nr:NAD(P)-binding oxidoreductase with NAD(P)-binding Rossmann-fold domain [Escherichia coli]